MVEIECKSLGGLGKFSIDICPYCSLLKGCDIAKVPFAEYRKREVEKQKALKDHRAIRNCVSSGELYCVYCGKEVKKCRCTNKPDARFEIRRKKL